MSDHVSASPSPPGAFADDDARARLAVIVAHSQDAIIASDASGHITAWNRGAEHLYGYSADEMIGRLPTATVPPELLHERTVMMDAALAGESVVRYDTRRVRKDGTLIQVAIAVSPLRDTEGQICGVSAFVRDVTARTREEADRKHSLENERSARADAARTQRRLAEAHERFRTAFDHAPIGVALLSVSDAAFGRFLEVNPALAEMTRYPVDELLGRDVVELMPIEHQQRERETIRELMNGERARGGLQRRFRRADGELVWFDVHASLVRNRDGHPLYAVAHFQDVTEAKRHEAKLRHLADHDPLTGLLNRRRFEEELAAAHARVRANGTQAAVLVIDLDDFKTVNDSYGHATGDELLRRVAMALRTRVRSSDAVGRLGGDEFGVILHGAGPDEAQTIADSLLAAVPIECATLSSDATVRVTASVGVKLVSANSAGDASELLEEADVAMYEAKDRGRNRSAVAGAGDEQAAGHAARPRWARRLHEALHNGGFVLWEQPLLNLRTNQCDRSELLVRMKGRAGETIAAGAFLQVAERSGQVQDIDRWVVSAALSLMAKRESAGSQDGVEINLSGASVSDEQVMDFVCEAVSSADVDPHKITFEITETAAIGDMPQAGRFVRQLARLGCRLALDDFGSGFGSFYHLKHLPFDVIKIDGEFVKELPDNPADQVTVRAVAELARGLGKQTVAEWVGDDETLALLRSFGVDYAQGFHVARPRPALAPSSPPAAARFRRQESGEPS